MARAVAVCRGRGKRSATLRSPPRCTFVTFVAPRARLRVPAWRACRRSMRKPVHGRGLVMNPSGERAAATLAARQHGQIASHQLRALGIDRRWIEWRARTGRLHQVHHGVYSVGHRRDDPLARYMAAVTCRWTHGSAQPPQRRSSLGPPGRGSGRGRDNGWHGRPTPPSRHSGSHIACAPARRLHPDSGNTGHFPSPNIARPG